MHRALLLLALATTDLCDTTSSTGAAGAGGGAAKTVNCAGAGNCSDCTTCAANGPCATLYATCQQDSDCESILECWSNCSGDTVCQQQDCPTDDTNAVSEHQALIDCIDCQQCAKLCVGVTTCS